MALKKMKKSNRTFAKIITKCNCSFGAPMRTNFDNRDKETHNGVTFAKFNGKVFDCAVPLDNGGYDAGGAYFGIGKQVRVSYTKDLQYIKFYRVGD